MNFKTLTTIIFFCLSACFVACGDDDDNNGSNDQLPAESAEFVQKYFPNNTIQSIHREEIEQDKGYRAELSGNISILFYSTANWYQITATQGIPQSAKSLINETTLEELKEAEPDALIVKLTSHYGFYSQKETHFQLANGNQYIDTHAFGQKWHLGKVESVRKAMTEIRDFLSRNELIDFADTPDSYFSSMTMEGQTIYRLTLSDILNLCFDQKGQWIYGKIGFTESGNIAAKLTEITHDELPEDILAIVLKQQEKGSLQTIVRYQDDTYGFEFKYYDFWVNAEGLLDAEGKIAKDFALEYLEKTDVIINQQEAIVTSPFECSTRYVASYQGGTFELLVNGSNGQWQALTVGKALPQKLIDSLPANIGVILGSKYSKVNFQSVKRDPKKEEMYTFLSTEASIYVTFDKDGKFVGQYLIIAE